MTDLPRLHETGDEDERALIRAARGYEPAVESRERLLIALGLAGTTTVAAAAASVAASSTVKASAAAGSVTFAPTAVATTKAAFSAKVWLLIASATIAAGGVSYGVIRSPRADLPAQSATAKLEAQAPKAVKPAREATDPFASPALAPQHSDAGPLIIPSPASTPNVGSRIAKRPRAAEPSPLTLTDELVSLDAARTALRNGDATRAWALLEGHQTRFAGAHLALEAEALRIRVLKALGRHVEARDRARSFMAAHPQSLLAQRLREIAQIAEPALDGPQPTPGGEKK